ncbi:MAG: hypothetical protein ACYC3X_30910 [Pirellulaceae bacterium]
MSDSVAIDVGQTTAGRSTGRPANAASTRWQPDIGLRDVSDDVMANPFHKRAMYAFTKFRAHSYEEAEMEEQGTADCGNEPQIDEQGTAEM